MYTYDDILLDIKFRGRIPSDQLTMQDVDFQRCLKNEMGLRIVPLLDAMRQGYLSYDQDYALSSFASPFAIPSRAVGAKIQDVALISGTRRMPCSVIEESIVRSTGLGSGNAVVYLKGNQIYVVGSTSGYDTLRVTFMLRPGDIVSQSAGAAITGISGNTVNFAAAPSTFTAGASYDIVQANPHFDTLGMALTVTGASPTSLTFSATLPARVAVGDWVSLSGQTPVIQCPAELHPLLAQYVANDYLRANPDSAAYKLGVEEVKVLEQNARILLAPRVERRGRKLVNRSGILRRRY